MLAVLEQVDATRQGFVDALQTAYDTGCFEIVLPDGRKLIAFSDERFHVLQAVFTHEAFKEELAKSVEEYRAGDCEELSDDELEY